MKKKILALACALAVAAPFPVMAGSPTAAVVAEQADSSSEDDSPSYTQEGFASSSDSRAASDRGMSAGEYYNNAVSHTPGVADAAPIGQGGKIIINGVPTNLTAALSKVDKTFASHANGQAAVLGGRLLNVLRVALPGANFNSATVNFYVKGFKNGMRAAARQYVGGVWIDVEVLEARQDHIVLNLKHPGVVAFVELPPLTPEEAAAAVAAAEAAAVAAAAAAAPAAP